VKVVLFVIKAVLINIDSQRNGTMQKFIIVGLGVFGRAVARNLMSRHAEVVAVDSKMDIIDEIQHEVTYAVCMDATDEKALEQLGIKDFDAGIVAIGENFEANLLTAVLLKNAGVKQIISRASNPLHIKILEAVGITKIVNPGIDAADKLVYGLVHRNLLDIVHIDDQISVAKIQAPGQFLGQSLGKLNLRAKYGVNCISINRVEETEKGEEKTVTPNPGAEVVIEENDIMVVIGDPQSLENLTKI
jgi:trk system potassium uptake protein TrkA